VLYIDPLSDPLANKKEKGFLKARETKSLAKHGSAMAIAPLCDFAAEHKLTSDYIIVALAKVGEVGREALKAQANSDIYYKQVVAGLALKKLA